MVQRTYIQLIDDIDGSEGEETHTFSVDGTIYEIDLSPQNGKRFREAFSPFLDKARRVRDGGPRRNLAPTAAERGVDPKVVRAWAIKNGYEISSRGRVSGDIVAVFKEAGGR